MSTDVSTETQLTLDLKVEKEAHFDDVTMGVLKDGTAYMNQNGLAKLCGVSKTSIIKMADSWETASDNTIAWKVKQSLKAQGVVLSKPFLVIEVDNRKHNAYPDSVCMAVLEHYAFEARTPNETALGNYRLMARQSLRQFVYTQVGYDPNKIVPDAWQQFHDRVTSGYQNIPAGYFSVFKEISDVVVDLIRNGANFGPEFVPDISVGIAWGKYWKNENLSAQFGERKKYDHSYPDYFAQALSNPQEANCYPESALPEYRRWMREVYLPEKLPRYLSNQVKRGTVPASLVEVAKLTYQSED
ncbi:hypothetical protein [Magnetococcus sp. PR-3]|uniref:hypothetical protein n=1 Tax=Magnetococcus sp. PR-3 TaxID=3120355 RepID=UPI002FCE5F75